MMIELSLMFVISLFAIAIIHSENLMNAVIYSSVFSLLSALLYLCLSAPDVALTEAAIGVCITSCLYLVILKMIKISHTKTRVNFGLILVFMVFAFIIYLYSVDIHNYGDVEAITNKGAIDYYKLNTITDSGLMSMVSVILASYRGFDTFGETLVILIAGVCVSMILGKEFFDKRVSNEK